jgi:hypothetical protein
MSDPRVLSIFVLVFLLLGVYNVLVLGSRRLREARERNRPIAWYKQINVLTGIEYTLLALVFMLSVVTRSDILPLSLRGLIFPIYLVLLLAAAGIAGFVIRQSFTNARNLRAASADKATASQNDTTASLDREQQKVDLERRRERRRNAAAARRRRAGKA